MKKRTPRKSNRSVEISSDKLAKVTGGAMNFNKLFPTLNAAANAVGDLQGQADGGPYQPGGAPPNYGLLG